MKGNALSDSAQPSVTKPNTLQNIGGTPVVSSEDKKARLSLLVWGKSGTGKTVLASTMPGKRLWLSFDPDGTNSFDPSPDDILVDLSKIDPRNIDRWEEGGIAEKDLASILDNDPTISSVIVDSVTSFGELALVYAVQSGKADGRQHKATLSAPGLGGYGIRNRVTLSFVRSILRTTGRAGRHVCLVCHENSADKDKDGNIESITILLGGDLAEKVPLQISEVWHLEDQGKRRILGLRPYAKRAPMRSRMFDTQGERTTFEFKYDARTKTGEGIKDWYAKWEAGSFKKLEVPK